MLNDSAVTANIPASDLHRARRFYADDLGLTPATENPGGARLHDRRRDGVLPLRDRVRRPGRPHHRAVARRRRGRRGAALRAKGLEFEHYDLPGVSWDGDVASMGEMGRAAWFKDSEDNIMCIDDVAV